MLGFFWLDGRIVEINIVILVACTSCFPSFFKQSKVFGSDVYSLLRSRMTTTTKPSSGDSAKSVSRANEDRFEGGGLLHTESAANAKPTSRGFFELKEVVSSKN